MNGKGYQLVKLRLDGSLYYLGAGESRWRDRNFFKIEVNGKNLFTGDYSDAEYKAMFSPNDDIDLQGTGKTLTMTSDEVDLVLSFQEINNYHLVISAELEISSDALSTWQSNVFRKLIQIEQDKVENEFKVREQEYNAAMATYRNRIDELKAMTVNELLQGESEAFNRNLILTELKKHCLTMLTKEFDADESDDLIGKIDAITNIKDADFSYHKFKLSENLVVPLTTFAVEQATVKMNYPSIHLDNAKEKGRYIQFLEQAFEWRQLAYVFYPYFWAARPKWIEKMSFTDTADANMTAFLQAGSVRVLLAVTPAYDAAVLHFLATREPWEGGPTPVIGDPLFIPLYEEVRKQQGLSNAVPEGQPWTFTLPTSLVYLDGSETALPTFPDVAD